MVAKISFSTGVIVEQNIFIEPFFVCAILIINWMFLKSKMATQYEMCTRDRAPKIRLPCSLDVKVLMSIVDKMIVYVFFEAKFFFRFFSIPCRQLEFVHNDKV